MPHKPQYDADTLVPRARVLRADATPAERELWQIARGNKLGVRFRRQQPIGPFIADFYCAQAGLIVELDGAGHADRIDYDRDRTHWLEGRGMTVLRFANAHVLEQPQDVYRQLLQAVLALTPAREGAPPLSLKGRGEKGNL